MNRQPLLTSIDSLRQDPQEDDNWASGKSSPTASYNESSDEEDDSSESFGPYFYSDSEDSDNVHVSRRSSPVEISVAQQEIRFIAEESDEEAQLPVLLDHRQHEAGAAVTALDISNENGRRVFARPSYLHHRHEIPRERPPPPPPAVEDNQAVPPIQQPPVPVIRLLELNVYRDALYYVFVPTSMIAFTMTLFLITCIRMLSPPRNEAGITWQEYLFCGLVGALTVCAVTSFVMRPHFLQIQSHSISVTTIVKINAYLTILCIPFLVLILLYVHETLEPITESINFFKMPTSCCDWRRLTVKIFFHNFTILQLVDIVLSLKRLSDMSSVFQEILVFELTAFLVPTTYILFFSTLLLDLIAVTVPREWQSLWMWTPLHLLGLLWMAGILYGMHSHPEITVQRQWGLLGYIYMIDVIMLQQLLAAHFNGFLMLTVSLFVKIPQNSWVALLMGPCPTFYKQIAEGIPAKLWVSSYPYPIFSSLWNTWFWTHLVRYAHLYIQLFKYAGRIHDH